VIARFDGGHLSSDGGLLVLREVEQRLDVAGRLAACIMDPRDPERVVHGFDEIIRFRLLMIAAGYEDGNDADRLRTDPMFKLAMARLEDGTALCSQPTISRLENLPDTRTLLRMGQAMVDLYCASFRQVPRRIVLDVDDTFDAVHGEQQMRLFNAHYDEYETWALEPAQSAITINLHARQVTARCPLCGRRSKRIHSRYERTLADLPWGEYAVTIRLSIRRLFCDNAECERRLFAERLPGIAAPWA